jgi:hypothetical protein
MKTITTLFLVFGFAILLQAANSDTILLKQIDSMRYVLLKPRLENYLASAETIYAEMKSTTDKELLRDYAKQLRDMTDSMNAAADLIYGYVAKYGSTFGMAYVFSSGTYVPAMMPTYSTTGYRPPVRDDLLKISGKSDNLRWSIGNKEKQLKRISTALDDLRKF